MAIVYPDTGDAPRIAAMLIALADNVNDVRTVHADGGFGFEVPDYLLEKYLSVSHQADDDSEDGPDDGGGELGEQSEPTQAPKKRGRPRKAATADDEVDNG